MSTQPKHARPERFTEEIEMLREAIRKVFDLAISSEDLAKASQALQAISQGAARLSRLIKADSEFSSRKDSFDAAFENALEQVMKEFNIDENW
jgi:hypothetical protein